MSRNVVFVHSDLPSKIIISLRDKDDISRNFVTHFFPQISYFKQMSIFKYQNIHSEMNKFQKHDF